MENSENGATEWEARANREAAAIIMGANRLVPGGNFDLLRRFVAVGWLQGYSVGAHEALSDATGAFRRLQEDLR